MLTPKSNSSQILIVEDDQKIASLLKQILINKGFNVVTAFNPNDAEVILKYIKCHIIILDYMLGEVSGGDFLAELRQRNILTPVVMLTALNETAVKLEALSQGADDYVTKPFNSEELVLRIKNILNRTQNISAKQIVSFSNMQFNKATGELTAGAKLIALSTQEEQLLQIFTSKLGEIVTKEEILELTNKALTEENLNTINVNIMRLRKKIEQPGSFNKCLKTIRNQGFLLKP